MIVVLLCAAAAVAAFIAMAKVNPCRGGHDMCWITMYCRRCGLSASEIVTRKLATAHDWSSMWDTVNKSGWPYGNKVVFKRNLETRKDVERRYGLRE